MWAWGVESKQMVSTKNNKENDRTENNYKMKRSFYVVEKYELKNHSRN